MARQGPFVLQAKQSACDRDVVPDWTNETGFADAELHIRAAGDRLYS